jgi:hypothetical protein
MSPNVRKVSAPVALMALATLACLCGPLGQIQSTVTEARNTAGTAQAVATEVGGGFATLGAVATTVLGTEQAAATQVAPALPTFQAQLDELRPTLIASDLEEVRQWAITAMATSQLSIPDYSAAQTTGQPNTETCGHAPTAWAPLDPQSPNEELTVLFAEPVIAFQVNIYESSNPGFVTQVRMVDIFGDTPIIYQAPPQLVQECPRILTINAPPGAERTSTVVISLDQTGAPSWTQIDAVELVGLR